MQLPTLALAILGPQRSDVRPLPRAGRVSIGRSSDNDISINDPLMSRHHAVIHVGDQIRLEDLGSENGTLVYLPGAPPEDDLADKVTQTTLQVKGDTFLLTEGAIVCLGTTRLLVRSAQEPAVTPVAQGPCAPRSPRMRALWDLADRAAVTQINVLLLGETGAGKEVLAHRIHQRSPRASQVFLRLNCAAFSQSLLESELFGHEKGAFTGALTAKPGFFESADGGTILLDEIGELPMPLQGKLLRLLEERSVFRIGALRPRPIDVRIIAATNRDLEAAIAAGTFRQDLYFRLHGLTLMVPPLRERVDEIMPLAETFAADFAARNSRPVPTIDPETREHLERYSWPGNVRELRNAIERAMVVATGRLIEPEHLPEAITRAPAATRDVRTAKGTEPPMAAFVPANAPDLLRQQAEELEREQIIRALEQCAGNQTKAAELLQMSRRALVVRLDRYAIPRPRKRGEPET